MANTSVDDGSGERDRGAGGLRSASGSRPGGAAMILFYLAYLTAAGVGHSLAKIPDVTITLWPPAGIVLATLLLWRKDAWGWFIGVALAADLTANWLWFHNSLVLAGAYFCGNVLESLAAAWLILRFVSPFQLKAMKEVVAFLLLGVCAAPMVNATIIATIDAMIGKHDFWAAWTLVWLGDGAGMLVTTPLVYAAVEAWRSRGIAPKSRVIEGSGLALTLVAMSLLCFGNVLPTMYFTLPVLLWAAARFQLRGGAAAMAFVTIVCASFAMTRSGRFDVGPELLRERIVLAQAFIGVSGVSMLLVAILSQRYLDAMESLRATNSELEARVAERTANLARSEAELRAHQGRLEHLVAERTRELEESVRQLGLSERMASLGTLSAGLGHDMANILVPMRMSLSNLERAELPTPRREDVQVLVRSSEYLKSLAMGLRLLALDPEDDARDTRTTLAQWWPEAAAICKAVLPRGVALHASGLEALPAVAIPSHALTQAVFNLIQNAGDAMRERGHGNVWIDAQSRSDGVVVRVRDDGPGMTEEVRQRCMEPFFTTKARGRGTGLGLAIVYRVLHRFGGSVELATAPGEGAEFGLVLPVAPASHDAGVSAIIQIQDARTRAIAHALVSGRGAKLLDGTPVNGDAALLIADAGATEGTVDRFLRSGVRRLVVRIGMDGVETDGGRDPRVVHVSDVRVANVHEAIIGALDQLEASR